MPQQIENNPQSAMLKEVAQVRNEARGAVKGDAQDESEELTAETPEIETSAQDAVTDEATAEETPETAETAATATADNSDEDDGPIRIGDQTFKTQAEAIRYAEQLERDKVITEAHSAGVREALEATRTQNQRVEPEPEDDFEQRFYTDPKGTLTELKKSAKEEAIAAIRAEQAKEKHWQDFCTEHPDLRRRDAERILGEQWETIGKLNLDAGKKALARAVRAEYEEIRNIGKPRTALPNKSAQVQSPSGGTAKSGVTPKKEEAPLTMAQQLRKLRGLN